MTAAQQAFDARVEEKIQSMQPYLVKVAEGDEDLIQEGAIGIWQAMQSKPAAGDGYFKQKAKWNIRTLARGVGRSVDTPKRYERKTPIHLVRIGSTAGEEGQLTEAALSDPKHVPMDEYVIQKVDLERFLATLTMREAAYLFMKMVWGISDPEAAERMDISITWLKQMKKTIRGKIEEFFAA